MKNRVSSATATMLGVIGCIVGAGSALSMGANYGTEQAAWVAFWVFAAILAPATMGGLLAESKKNKTLRQTLSSQKKRMELLTNRYNKDISTLERRYREEKSQLGTFNVMQKESLRLKYSKEYSTLRDAYKREKQVFIAAFDDEAPFNAKMKQFWKFFFVAAVIALFTGFFFAVGAIAAEEPTTEVVENQRYWNAENIPIPFLTDKTRYVSNPDGVVTPETEQQLNVMLKRLDDSLQIQSVMILVNHIENDDPFRFAQDVGNKYGVGYGDRGLIIVLGYEDHAINMSPGRSLEADLTDAECYRLQQRYVVPCMKAEQPDSGMLYLTEAIYSLLQQKELPVMSAQEADTDYDEEEDLFDPITLFIYTAMALFVTGMFVRSRYEYDSSTLRSNPFSASSSHFVGGGGGGRSSGGGWHSSGGSHFSGGSFGGGSFGGGGATSRW